MRLILIREPIITLLLLLSLMLTTASPPVCTSFSVTIHLCLRPVSPPGCLCLTHFVASTRYATCLLDFPAESVSDCVSCLQPCSFVWISLIHHVISIVIICDTHIQECFRPEGTNAAWQPRRGSSEQFTTLCGSECVSPLPV